MFLTYIDEGWTARNGSWLRERDAHPARMGPNAAVPAHPYVCLKQRLALSQNSFWRIAGVMLDQSMILSTESGNQLS